MTRKLRLSGIILAASFAALLASPAETWAQKGNKPGGGGSTGPSYQIIELDSADGFLPGGAGGINNTGLIVGDVHDPILDEAVAACWTVDKVGQTVTSTLHLLDGRLAIGVNDSGEIVGERNGIAVYWSNRNAAPLVLPTPAGTTLSRAIAINANGVVCGWLRGQPDTNGLSLQSAALWRINLGGAPTPDVWGPLVLPRLTPDDLQYFAADLSDNASNGAARVVGGTFGDSSFALTWTVVSQPDGSLALDAGPTVLNVGSALGVSSAGLICGRVQPDAVVWDATSMRVLDKSRSFDSAEATAINASGVIVGYGSAGLHSTAVAWPDPAGSVIVLDKFLRRNTISELNVARAVNDSGNIVGSGWDGGRGISLGFLAIPK